MGGQQGKKRGSRIAKLEAEFHKNHRLQWVFKICSDLSIDDPVTWMNNVDPAVVDGWIAYHLAVQKMEESATSGDKLDMETARDQLLGMVR